jgi:hypothetical protein
VSFAGFAIVELLGHNRHAGYVTEEQHFGATLGRVDVPDVHSSDPKAVLKTHYFGGSSVFRITPCSEAIAREVAGQAQLRPTSFQLAAPEPVSVVADSEFDEVEEKFPW